MVRIARRVNLLRRRITTSRLVGYTGADECSGRKVSWDRWDHVEKFSSRLVVLKLDPKRHILIPRRGHVKSMFRMRQGLRSTRSHRRRTGARFTGVEKANFPRVILLIPCEGRWHHQDEEPPHTESPLHRRGHGFSLRDQGGKARDVTWSQGSGVRVAGQPKHSSPNGL